MGLIVEITVGALLIGAIFVYVLGYVYGYLVRKTEEWGWWKERNR